MADTFYVRWVGDRTLIERDFWHEETGSPERSSAGGWRSSAIVSDVG